jgi:hypothetical protein
VASLADEYETVVRYFLKQFPVLPRENDSYTLKTGLYFQSNTKQILSSIYLG